MRKVFLKLDGIKDGSQSARRIGEVEISSFYWGGGRPSNAAGGGRAKALTKAITVIKRVDQASPFLQDAAARGARFEGFLKLEDFSARGSLVRSIVFELQSVLVDSVTGIEAGEVVALSCRSVKLRRSPKEKIWDAESSVEKKEKEKEAKIMKRNLVIMSIFIAALALCSIAVSGQFAVRLPNIKIKKPDKDQAKKTDATTTNHVKTNNVKTKTTAIP